MKLLAHAFVLCILLAANAHAKQIAGTAVRVVDGDTFDLRSCILPVIVIPELTKWPWLDRRQIANSEFR